jgi:hypothetical protein
MKKLTIGTLCFVILLCAYASLAQSDSKISIPSTPAFSILGFEPASIMRPATPKELSADILNSFDKNGELLLNLGIEVAPYWLQSRPNLTRKQLDEATGFKLFIQTLLLSAATVKDSATGNNKLGAGLRFKLLNGRRTAKFEERQAELKATSTVNSLVTPDVAEQLGITVPDSLIAYFKELMIEDEIDQEDISEFEALADKLKGKYPSTAKNVEKFALELQDSLNARTRNLRQEVSELSGKRDGLVVELAVATAWITNSTDQFEKGGIWLNASQLISTHDAFTFSARYFFSTKDSVVNNADFGLGYIKEVENFSLSIEALGRAYRAEVPDLNQAGESITRLEKDFTYRLAVQAAYRISKDISVNLSLGKDFDAPFIGRSGFFSIFGLNYSILKNAADHKP